MRFGNVTVELPNHRVCNASFQLSKNGGLCYKDKIIIEELDTKMQLLKSEGEGMDLW